MISALAHYSYCPRRCALIHVESLFDENLFTLRGTRLHERVDQPTTRTEKGLRVERGLPLWSDEHGLIGRADVVEWLGQTPQPVEYKSGRPKNTRHGSYQLCAQAICLEEMTGQQVPTGWLYFFESKQRIEVEFTADLRSEVLDVVQRIRAMMAITHPKGQIPEPVADHRCRNCSLLDACMPFAVRKAASPQDLFQPRKEVELP